MGTNGWPFPTYHDLNDPSDYPDDSYELRNRVIRAFRTSGQQMWDEDQNNTISWVRRWTGMWAMYRRMPAFPPWDTRFTRVTICDQWTGSEDIRFDDMLSGTTSYLSPFMGVRAPVLADRMLVGYKQGDDWTALCTWQDYPDTIELAFFMSEMRAGKVAARYWVTDTSFVLPVDVKGSRVRGWVENPALIIEKNGVPVGTAWVSMYSSGATMSAETTFVPGDVLSIRCPSTYGTGKRAVSVSLIGKLL